MIRTAENNNTNAPINIQNSLEEAASSFSGDGISRIFLKNSLLSLTFRWEGSNINRFLLKKSSLTSVLFRTILSNLTRVFFNQIRHVEVTNRGRNLQGFIS